MQLAQLLLLHWVITIKKSFFLILFLFSLFIQGSLDDYIYSDIGETSNIHGELGIINIPSSRILDEGNLKLHLVNSEPVNSLLITATPFDWMEVSLRYADINTAKYSPYPSFSGDQTYKDKSFNLKLRLIEESDRFPGLSIGFRDFIGSGKFSGEYIVSSKKIGDFDFSVGLGWGALSGRDGLKNPLIDIDNSFSDRKSEYNRGINRSGTLGLDRWFKGEKVSAFYGFEYINKHSGLRFSMDYDSSNPFSLDKESDFAFGLSIPASKYLDIKLFRHRGTSLGFALSYKANYSKSIIKSSDLIPIINFNNDDLKLLSSRDEVFSGTINVLLARFGIYSQQMFLDSGNLEIIIDQTNYRNLNTATKRVIQLTKEVLGTREIKNVRVTFQNSSVNVTSVNFPLEKFLKFLQDELTLTELRRSLEYKNYTNNSQNKIFQGVINYPAFSWGIRPDLKNHIGAPESFYSGQLGIFIGGGIKFSDQTFMESTISLSIIQNMDQLRLRSWSRMQKVRSDVREYLKEKYALRDLTFSYIFDPSYNSNYLFFGGLKVGLFEEMYGGIGGEILFRDISKPWYLTANYYWVKQREFNQRFSFRNYETFTGHLNFVWETPIDGVKMILSGGRYLARDSGFTLNVAKTFKSGFTLGFFATKTDVSEYEFGEGAFDKGIYFSIPLDLISSKHRKNSARFVWRNLTKDGGAMLSGGLDLQGYVEDTSMKSLDYFNDGFYE